MWLFTHGKITWFTLSPLWNWTWFTAIESGLANYTNELLSVFLANAEVSLEQSRSGMLFTQGGFSKFELFLKENRLCPQSFLRTMNLTVISETLNSKTLEHGRDRIGLFENFNVAEWVVCLCFCSLAVHRYLNWGIFQKSLLDSNTEARLQIINIKNWYFPNTKTIGEKK